MSKCILVVEDHVDNMKIMRDLLSNAGYEVIEATTGERALEIAATERLDLILMDIQLPGIDGLDTSRRIKGDPALCHIPVIAVTSFALSSDSDRALEAGCDAYFAKPVRPRTLLAKIREYIP